MKTYYELISVDPSADPETIKKAFRREIAKYHPDKVTHLGAEFQEMAAARAAELTAAYKILSDSRARADYDEALKGGAPSAAPSATAPNVPAPSASWSPSSEPQPAHQTAAPSRIEQDRVGKEDIVRRATLARVRGALATVMGDCEQPAVRGFDLAYMPRSKPVSALAISQLFKKDVIPVVLVRFGSLVDGPMATDAFAHAVRARLDTKGKPIAILLIGNQLAPAGELAKAIEDARRKSPGAVTIFPVPIDGRDWSAKIPLNAPETVRNLLEKLRSSA